jgi:hypothetical protein
LRQRDASWGIRDVSQIEATAASVGYKLERRVDMPANNMSLIFKKGETE